MHFDKFKGASFKHNTSLPQIIFSKYPNKVCLVPNLVFLFRKKLNVFDKFEGASFKYETSYLQNNQLRHSFLPLFVTRGRPGFQTGFVSGGRGRRDGKGYMGKVRSINEAMNDV